MNKNFRILSYTKKLCIVIDKDATAYSPYVLKDGILFNPRTGFYPVNPHRRTRRLLDEISEEARQLIESLREEFEEELRQKAEKDEQDKLQEKFQEKFQEVKDDKKEEEGARAEQPSSTLDSLIARSVAEISVGSVLEKVKPIIDDYVKTTYGVLPKVLEVKTEKELRKVEGCVHKEFETILKLIAADIPVFFDRSCRLWQECYLQASG